MNIRKAIKDDLKQIQKLNNKLFEKEYNEYDDSIKIGWNCWKMVKNILEI